MAEEPVRGEPGRGKVAWLRGEEKGRERGGEDEEDRIDFFSVGSLSSEGAGESVTFFWGKGD